MKIVKGSKRIDFKTHFRDLRHILEYAKTNYNEIPAYIFHEGKQKTTVTKSYTELEQDIVDFAVGLADLSKLTLSQGEKPHFAVIGNNSYPWVVFHNAVLFGLGISVPLDKQLPDHEVVDLCERGKVEIFGFDYAHKSAALELVKTNSNVNTLVLFDQEDKLDELNKEIEALNSACKIYGFEEILEFGQGLGSDLKDKFRAIELPLEEMAVLSFTSGTTSTSKGVMLSHLNLVANVNQAISSLDVPSGLRALSVLPLHHCFESTVGMWCLWAYGITICINESLRTLVPNLKEWKINVILTVPLMLSGIHRQVMKTIEKSGKTSTFNFGRKLSKFLLKLGIDKRREIFKSVHAGLGGELQLLISGAAALAPEVQSFFEEIGVASIAGYGLTETAPILAADNPNNSTIGSVGEPLCGVSLAIDGDGHNPETAGEILAKGDNVMLGYYNDPENTADSFTPDGWFRTGDMGYFDENNLLYITGRAKSCIVLSNGKNVFPEELESFYINLPGIKNIMIWGEDTVRGAVDLVARFQIDREALPEEVNKDSNNDITDYLQATIRKINDRMAVYKRVKNFIWDESDPEMTTTLKIKRDPEIKRIKEALAKKNLDIHSFKTGYFAL
ncbi:MAG: AMP-binding protein [Clostridiaceae bacterium]|nr:AMP-binding protein [Clostridiaceae bacterium]